MKSSSVESSMKSNWELCVPQLHQFSNNQVAVNYIINDVWLIFCKSLVTAGLRIWVRVKSKETKFRGSIMIRVDCSG